MVRIAVISAPTVRAANALFRRHFNIDVPHTAVFVNPGDDDGSYRLSYANLAAEVQIVRQKPAQVLYVM